MINEPVVSLPAPPAPLAQWNEVVVNIPSGLNALSYLTGVGSKGFVEKLKSVLIGSVTVSGRKLKEAGEGYQLREPSVPYKVNFDVKNDDIGPENRHFGDINVD